jgi:transposase InsO family protein
VPSLSPSGAGSAPHRDDPPALTETSSHLSASTREAARQDVFEYIEMFYNPKRKHTNNGMLSPVDFETRQQRLNEAGV